MQPLKNKFLEFLNPKRASQFCNLSFSIGKNVLVS